MGRSTTTMLDYYASLNLFAIKKDTDFGGSVSAAFGYKILQYYSISF